VSAISALLSLSLEVLQHWLMFPLTLVGIQIGVDVVRVRRQEIDLFDPRSLVSFLGFHMFYIAPLLHLTLDYWPLYLEPAQDWRQTLGVLASLNAGGLVIFRSILSVKSDRPHSYCGARTFAPKSFYLTIFIAILLSLGFFVFTVQSFGGIEGYLSIVSDRLDREALRGSGWQLIIAEAFPLMLFVFVVVGFREELSSRSPAVLATVFLGFVALQFFVGGLRGSRSNTIWPIIIALTIVHLLVRKISGYVVVFAIVVGLSFMYFYGFYKSLGTDALDRLQAGSSVSELSDDSGKDVEFLLLEDLSRIGIQAVIVDRLQFSSPTLALGSTYVGDASIIVPSFILPRESRPDSKVEFGSDLLRGPGSADAGVLSSRIYGLGGEAMLNFGLIGVPLSFAVLGFVTRWASRRYRFAELSRSIPAVLLVAPLGVFSLMVLIGDLDNLIWFAIKQVLPIASVALLSQGTLQRSAHSQRIR